MNDNPNGIFDAALGLSSFGLNAHADTLLLGGSRPYSRSVWATQIYRSRWGKRLAEMITMACAMGKSSVMVRSMRGSCPSGVRLSST